MSHHRRIHQLLAVVAVLAATLVAASSASAAVGQLDPLQWGVQDSPVQANTYDADYTITSLNEGSALIGHHRTFGVDLDWGNGQKVSTGFHHWSFRRRSGADGPISPSEPVALYDNFTHRYLAYGHEGFGINLQFYDDPRYDWRIAQSGRTISLFNISENDYVVYGQRPFGINLMWLKALQSQVASTESLDRTHTVVLQAQPVIEGYVPFYGSFGGGVGTTGTLKTVTNANPGVTLDFVKPGHSTQDCGTPADVIALPPYGTLTAAQMTAEWGIANPSLPVQFLACAAGTSRGSVALNIVYHGVA